MTTALLDPPAPAAAVPAVRHPAVAGRLRDPRVRQAVAFVLVGTAATVVQLVVYLLLRSVVAAAAANLVAQVVSTLLSTSWHRRWTVGVTDGASVARHHGQMLGLLSANLVLNTAALQVLSAVDPAAGAFTELAVLTASGLVVTVARIALLRRWGAGR